MTPRHVAGRNSATSDFARQLAQRNATANPVKQWKSSAPKGVKLAKGYVDRTKDRKDDEEDERVQRIKALEEAMKAGQIDRATFEGLVQEMAGGDIESTHLVRGLDRKLLERLRRGEDVQAAKSPSAESSSGGNDDDDEDDELDALAQQEIVPVSREKTEKKGEKAPPKPIVGAKRTRDALLAELKAQRKAAAEAAAAEHEMKYPALGPGFRKVGPKGESTRIEIDSRGREVLVITDADGKEKRKVRKQKKEQPPLEVRHDIDNPDKPVRIPDLPPPPEELSEDEDIFAGVGSNFNPLVDVDGSDDSSSEDEGMGAQKNDQSRRTEQKSGEVEEDKERPDEGESSSNQPQPSPKPVRRNYFNDNPARPTVQSNAANDTVLAALKKVRTLDPNSSLIQTDEEARLKKRAAMLGAQDRDMEDLDMGFGSSRFDDADEMEKEGEKIKLAEWKGLGAEDDDEEDGQNGPGAKRRKRGPKKRKGDKNNAADVLKVMERQKGSKTLG